MYLQHTSLPEGADVVIEVYLPEEDLTRGVAPAWVALSVVALTLVLGSVFVADRLGAKVVEAARGLARAARAFGSGDLKVRVDPGGPPELAEAGASFNAMAARVVQFLDAERELAADLSHRLRTPLTALRLDVEGLGRAPTPTASGSPSAPSNARSTRSSRRPAGPCPSAVRNGATSPRY